MRSRLGETAYTDSNSEAPLSNETTWPKRGGRTTSHFGDGVSFHGAHTHCCILLGGEADILEVKLSLLKWEPSRAEAGGLRSFDAVDRIRTERASGEKQEEFYSHIWNALRSAVRSPPLTASAACFKMAARLLFIFCWSPPNFHCLFASRPTDSQPSIQVCLIRYRL